MSINVTKTYLPPLEDYVKYLEKIWASGWVTNNGALVQDLEKKLAEYLGVPHVQYVSNGTVALQLALKALEVEGEVITTPFSYVATVNSILWEHCTPVFVDIEDRTFNMDSANIEAAISQRTSAILPVHVYGYPCDVHRIQELAQKYNLKVIYDGAHAFGCELNGISLLNYGDLSTLSFHATKLFHTVEGGAIIAHTPAMADRLWKLKSFGHRNDDYFFTGINGKNSELHAAMGLCILPKVNELIEKRQRVFKWYRQLLEGLDLVFPRLVDGLKYNYSYFPVLFESEGQLLRVVAGLKQNDIIPRRYFYPALNTLPFVRGQDCPVAEDISRRVLCLPLYVGLEESQVEIICKTITASC
jgi:dTDP-4-amino-4,6-dideoxygalactose transaminase